MKFSRKHPLFLSLCAFLLPKHTVAAQNGPEREVSAKLFESLEESSRLVDIAYCIGSTGVHKPFECLSRCQEFEGFELITTWNTGPLLSDSCGYIAISHPPYPKRIIVAFRGTYSVTNTIIDLSAYPQRYVPYIPDDNEGGGDDPREKAKCTNCTVHAGFMTTWQNTRSTVLPAVETARKQHPDYEIVLIGHSLGGAVAALAGLEFQLKGWSPQVTTFGEPKLGNRAFVNLLDEAFSVNVDQSLLPREEEEEEEELPRFRRVTHANDPVPLLPLDEWGYETHAGEIFISKPDLPPGRTDLERCEGNRDLRCIEGASYGSNAVNIAGGQTVLSEQPRRQRIDGAGLIPARFRLWELFFAHRDYFWRLGLCVPGGDPTGLKFKAD
ncbi:hypothetical protein ASPZODRAFT_130904 [Penicilliopsis zonata CBS 506.65]|uniref:Fungal lipase-type domain-containing protein n=1 Tax=Penicilliopsis zonata CBS 506.65 TaxID=1073090 RepID=A0A1L9SK25_9EURO|nr:hypothetical protein ASPZODRAFT_130904 [Penicilliopsis zonata CBS 506.65]OJJ47441.1 hypothetical protein ASPZODRAFT_130904 [Penicilliopsis zonata CBS 506.65]